MKFVLKARFRTFVSGLSMGRNSAKPSKFRSFVLAASIHLPFAVFPSLVEFDIACS